MRALVVVLVAQLAGCGDNAAPPATDAALPRCADVGCPDVALCNTAGVCTCPQPPPAPPVECRR